MYLKQLYAAFFIHSQNATICRDIWVENATGIMVKKMKFFVRFAVKAAAMKRDVTVPTGHGQKALFDASFSNTGAIQ